MSDDSKNENEVIRIKVDGDVSMSTAFPSVLLDVPYSFQFDGDNFETMDAFWDYVRRLRMIVDDLATANPKRYSGRAEDPQNDVDDVVDAVTFDALQADAKALVEGLKDE